MTVADDAPRARARGALRATLFGLALLFYGCGLILMVRVLLGPVVAYDRAMEVTSTLAVTTALVGLLAGCVAAGALSIAGIAARSFPAAVVLAAVAGFAAFIGSSTAGPASIAPTMGLFVLAGPVLVASAVGRFGDGLVSKIGGGVMAVVLIAAAAAITASLNSDFDAPFWFAVVCALLLAVGVAARPARAVDPLKATSGS